VRYRQSLILPLVLALAACATTPAPEAPSAPASAQSTPLPVIHFAPPPAPIVLANPFDGGVADLEPLPPSPGDLWDRIVRGYAIPDMDGPLVDKWERWYAERPDYVARMVERSRRYLYHIVSEVEARSGDEVRLASPRDALQRGSHVVFAHPEGYAIMQALIARGVIGDFRAPDLMRFGFAPLYNTHSEMVRAAEVLADILATREWDQPRFKTRAKVT